MSPHRCHLPALALIGVAAVPAAAQLTVASAFLSGLSPVACAHDPGSGTVWVYPSFGSAIHRFDTAGTPLGSIPRPGAAANDADLEVVPVAFQLGATAIAAGSLLYIDGENGAAEVWAIDPGTGTVLGSLTTAFGSSHVVGGAFDPLRRTIWLVQDRVPAAAAARNLVAEIDPVTGQVLGSFQTTQGNPAFTVNYGDLEVTANGNLLLVSSDEAEIGQFSPTGAWVQGHPLPLGVADLCGIGLDPTGCGSWVAATTGGITRLTSPCAAAVVHGSGCPSSGGSNTLVVTAMPWAGSSFRAAATGLPATGFAVAVTGFTALTPPLPLSLLLPQGSPGCTMQVTADATGIVPIAGGSVQTQLAIPAGLSLGGVQFFHQLGVLELDPQTSAIVQATSTDSLRLTIGSY